MPLMKSSSKKAFEKNVSTEMEAGKPQKQSLAIAYSTQRHNKKKKFAEGGKVGGKTDARNAGGMDPNEDDHDTMMALGGAVEGKAHSGRLYDRDPGAQAPKPDDSRRPVGSFMARDWSGAPELEDASDTSMRPAQEQYMGNKWARGGEVHPSELMTDDERSSSIAEAIMRKRKMMAEGGMVDVQENGEEEGSSPYDDMNATAAKKELYDDSQISAQPDGSNEHGDDIESDKHDMISQIRAKMKAKRV